MSCSTHAKIGGACPAFAYLGSLAVKSKVAKS